MTQKRNKVLQQGKASSLDANGDSDAWQKLIDKQTIGETVLFWCFQNSLENFYDQYNSSYSF